jgi:hypothetical protein
MWRDCTNRTFPAVAKDEEREHDNGGPNTLETPRLQEEAPEPLETNSTEGRWRTLHSAREEIERPTNPHRDAHAREFLEMLRDPEILLRCTEGNEEKMGSCVINALNNGVSIFCPRTPRVCSNDAQSRILSMQN